VSCGDLGWAQQIKITGENESLLVWGDSLFVLDFRLDILDGVRRLHFQSDRLAGQSFHEDLHSARLLVGAAKQTEMNKKNSRNRIEWSLICTRLSSIVQQQWKLTRFSEGSFSHSFLRWRLIRPSKLDSHGVLAVRLNILDTRRNCAVGGKMWSTLMSFLDVLNGVIQGVADWL